MHCAQQEAAASRAVPREVCEGEAGPGGRAGGAEHTEGESFAGASVILCLLEVIGAGAAVTLNGPLRSEQICGILEFEKFAAVRDGLPSGDG